MKNFKNSMVVIIMLAVSVANAYSNEEVKTKFSGASDTVQVDQNKQASLEDTSKVYTCPMHPEVVSKTPGTCPKCGMDLVIKDSNSNKHKGMCCMGMMHFDNNKSHIWMYIAGGVMMVVMMSVMVLSVI